MSGGKFRELLDTLGQLVILSVLWMLLMLPVVKSIRAELGDPVQEFWSCFRRTWKKGLIHSLLAVFLLGALLLGALTVSPVYWVGLAVLCVVLLYLGPVLSRFNLKFWEIWSLSFVVGVRSLHLTVLTAGAAVAAALAQFYLIPMAAVLILPGAMCLGASFPMEKAMERFMPPKETE